MTQFKRRSTAGLFFNPKILSVDKLLLALAITFFSIVVASFIALMFFVHESLEIDVVTPQPKLRQQQHLSSPSDRILHSDIIDARKAYGARESWLELIRIGKDEMKRTNHQLTLMEVGVYSAEQCLDAALAKFHSHCLEPSPKSFHRIREEIKTNEKVQKNSEVLKYLHLYNVAAGDKSDTMLKFHHEGGTGDHVGKFDMWKMKSASISDDYEESLISTDHEPGDTTIEVPSVKLDDVIMRSKVKPDSNFVGGSKGPIHTIDEVFAMKIDTQGFEPNVFAGMKESIQNHKIKYILFEYWPKAMDLIAGELGGHNQCNIAVNLLNMLTDAGYTLYALPLVSHPSLLKTKDNMKTLKHGKNRPFNDFRAHCLYLREEMEQRLPSDDCQMGIWTDILAVAPHVEMFKPSKPKDLESVFRSK